MPHTQNSVPSYPHHKPSGQAFMRVTLPGGTRKTIYFGVFGRPESKPVCARRVQVAETNTVTTVDGPKEADLTVAERLVGYLEHAERHYRHPDGKPTSEIWSFKLVVKPLKELFAYLPVRECGPHPPIRRHRYFFKLYALDLVLPDLDAPTKSEREKAMHGHILARAEMIGTYQKAGHK